MYVCVFGAFWRLKVPTTVCYTLHLFLLLDTFIELPSQLFLHYFITWIIMNKTLVQTSPEDSHLRRINLGEDYTPRTHDAITSGSLNLIELSYIMMSIVPVCHETVDCE